MPNIIHNLKQFSVYIDNVLVQGNVSEVHIPRVELESVDVIPNTFMPVEFPTGIKKLIAAIKMRGIFAEVAGAFDGVNGEPNTTLEIRAALENYRSEVIQAKWRYVGLAKSFEVTPLRMRELTETTLAVNAHTYEFVMDGKEVHFFDAFNNVQRIKGHDRLINIRRALEQEIFSAVEGAVTEAAVDAVRGSGSQAFEFVRDAIF